MAIAATHILTAQNGTGATSYATASGSPTTGKLQLFGVGNQVAAGTPNEPTVTGAGLTWVKVDTKVSTGVTTRRATLFRALGTASAGALTIDLAGQTQVRCGWSWSEADGMDTSGTNGSGAIVQSATGETTDGAASTTLVATLAAFGSVNNATYGFIRFGGSSTTDALTAGSGFTQLGIQNGSASYQSQWKATNDTSVDWTYNSTSWYSQAVAVEIKAATASVVDTTLKTTQEYLNAKAGTTGKTQQEALQILGSRPGATAQEAANAYAGTTGLTVQEALNVKVGTVGLTTQEAAARL